MGGGGRNSSAVIPPRRSALNFVPPLFCLYLLALLPLWWLTPLGKLSLWPLAGYALAVLAQGLVSAVRGPVWQSVAALPVGGADASALRRGLLARAFYALTPPAPSAPSQVVLETPLSRNAGG